MLLPHLAEGKQSVELVESWATQLSHETRSILSNKKLHQDQPDSYLSDPLPDLFSEQELSGLHMPFSQSASDSIPKHKVGKRAFNNSTSRLLQGLTAGHALT